MKLFAVVATIVMGLSVASDVSAQDLHPTRNALDQGSDACPATVIYQAPYYDEGSTVGMANDYGSTWCGGLAADVIYEYTPAETDSYSVTLCGSNFDTVLHIREGGPCPGDSQVVCNDDYCFLTSTVNLRMFAGHTYYIVVDGYSASSGSYRLTMGQRGECEVHWWHRDSIEVSEYPIDSVFCQHDPTGGCSTDPPIFQAMKWGEDGLTGRTFNYYDSVGLLHSDEDWFRFTVIVPETVRTTILAGIPIHLEMLRLWDECDSVSLISQMTQTECSLTTITQPCLRSGDYCLRVTCAAETLISLPQLYRVTITGSWNSCLCDSVVDLTAMLSPNREQVWLHWDADSNGEEFWIYSTADENAPFSPDSLWQRRAIHTATMPGRQCWTDPDTASNQQRYVVVRSCL